MPIVVRQPLIAYQVNEIRVPKQIQIVIANPASQPINAPRAVARRTRMPRRNSPTSGPPISPMI